MMSCEEFKPWFAEYWSRTLDQPQKQQLERHLEECADCRAEAARLESLWRGLALLPSEEPTPAVRDRFYETLAAYRDGAADGTKDRHTVMRPRSQQAWWLSRIAAGLALVAGGAGIGYGIAYGFRSNQASVEEITQLRGEIGNMRQLVTLSLLQQQSASERLRGVSWAVRAEPSDTEVLDALLSHVNHDPNVNVRLAAVDALRPFAANRTTASAVAQSLASQTDPIVQIALIDLLVDLKEKNAAHELQQMALDGAADTGVRQRAQWALSKLDGLEKVQ